MAAKAAGTWQVLKGIPSSVGITFPTSGSTIVGPLGDIGAPGSVTQVDTTQAYALGTRILARDTGATNYGTAEFTYTKGVVGCAVFDTLALTELGVAVRTVAGSKGRLALAVSAIDAATKFGWVQTAGLGVVTCGTVADNAGVYVTAAAGVADDTVVIGDCAIGATFASADDTATALLSFPNGAYLGGANAAS